MPRNPNLIRVGDTVRILSPQLFIRCGYPMSLQDSIDKLPKDKESQVIIFLKEKLGIDLPLFCNNDYRIQNSINKIIAEIGFIALSELYNFGGSDRIIVTKTEESIQGIVAVVESIKYVYTGRYRAASQGCDGEWDPPYLSNQKVHKILTLNSYYEKHEELNTLAIVPITTVLVEQVVIESIHVEKVIRGQND